jgi:hypothetical protein
VTAGRGEAALKTFEASRGPNANRGTPPWHSCTAPAATGSVCSLRTPSDGRLSKLNEENGSRLWELRTCRGDLQVETRHDSGTRDPCQPLLGNTRALGSRVTTQALQHRSSPSSSSAPSQRPPAPQALNAAFQVRESGALTPMPIRAGVDGEWPNPPQANNRSTRRRCTPAKAPCAAPTSRRIWELEESTRARGELRLRARPPNFLTLGSPARVPATRIGCQCACAKRVPTRCWPTGLPAGSSSRPEASSQAAYRGTAGFSSKV